MSIPGKRVLRTRLVRTQNFVVAVEGRLSSRKMTPANPATKPRRCNSCVKSKSTRSRATWNGFNSMARSIRHWRPDKPHSQATDLSAAKNCSVRSMWESWLLMAVCGR
jgi:hypothetical protein